MSFCKTHFIELGAALFSALTAVVFVTILSREIDNKANRKTLSNNNPVCPFNPLVSPARLHARNPVHNRNNTNEGTKFDNVVNAINPNNPDSANQDTKPDNSDSANQDTKPDNPDNANQDTNPDNPDSAYGLSNSNESTASVTIAQIIKKLSIRSRISGSVESILGKNKQVEKSILYFANVGNKKSLNNSLEYYELFLMMWKIGIPYDTIKDMLLKMGYEPPISTININISTLQKKADKHPGFFNWNKTRMNTFDKRNLEKWFILLSMAITLGDILLSEECRREIFEIITGGSGDLIYHLGLDAKLTNLIVETYKLAEEIKNKDDLNRYKTKVES